MDWIQLFFGFFISNALGYGGGPSSIPLMYEEIVNHYHWLDNIQFSNMLALGNMLPGPIATKIAAFVGYEAGGWVGFAVSIIATVVPTAVALIWLLNLMQKYRKSDAVKGMTLLVQPVIAIMMVVMTWQLSANSVHTIGIWQSLGIAAVAYFAMVIKKFHPALVIVCAFVYGGIFLS
ncbi:chromate transporter [Paenibacillus sp. WQ 127069]|uniref:Chromate transporter n=1 Tax=Paenibacillus baimaensis TaxID=2982185 RepID=A0ABT2UNF3_9BACL|nr:chromate transporter [Paenibacillus sp. WQ 127069]MCU6796178.1 chromate transporter [Paenibacillus sp. WQ 127069]